MALLAVSTLVGCGARTGLFVDWEADAVDASSSDSGARPHDAGTDAGHTRLDASAAIDSGAVVGLDASAAIDSGAVVGLDASVVGLDASVGDDGGATDSGPEDAGLFDAQVPPSDSGTPDAGPSCGTFEMWCGGRCVDVANDVSNCGACGMVCPTGRVCQAGRCACPPPTMNCGNACVDVRDDRTNCGSCGNRCAPTASCETGTCRCPPGQLSCAGSCVDPNTDARHCGACGEACGIRCDAGQCLDVVDVSVGYNHVCAVTSDRAVSCWGSNFLGATGVTSTSNLLRPARVGGIDEAIAVACTEHSSCALRTDGSIWCWGSGAAVGTGDPLVISAPPQAVAGIDRAVSIARGGYFICALRDEGSTWCWGRSYQGIFGDGTGSTPSAIPRLIPDVPPLVQLSGGGDHICGTTAGGEIYCWGSNGYGQLGRGTQGAGERPGRVVGLPTASRVAAGYWHTCALGRDLRAYCWGHQGYGALGNGNTDSGGLINVTTPSMVRRTRSDFVELAAGDFANCAITLTGEPWCWGANDWGMLGDGTNVPRGDPVQPLGLSRIASVSMHWTHTCFLSVDGALRCAGWNLHGEIGDGTMTPRFTATPVAW